MLADERTEYLGRGAGRTNLSLVVGRTVVGNWENETIAEAKSNHVQSPLFVTWTVPVAFLEQSWTMARAKSMV